MDAQLKERAQKVAAMGNRRHGFTEAEFKEIEEVYMLVIGHYKECYSCVVYGLIREISQKLIQEPLNIKFTMATKGHFKSGAASTGIIRHGKNGTTVITPDNINEGDNFEWAAKHYPHLVAESKAKAEDAEPAKTATKTTTTTPAKK